MHVVVPKLGELVFVVKHSEALFPFLLLGEFVHNVH